MRTAIAFLAALIVVPLEETSAQAVARRPYPDALARPVALRSMRTCDPSGLMATLQTALRAERFMVTSTDDASLMIGAQRDSTDNWGQGIDRVILWVERDFERPQQIVRIYLIYGRYDRLLGSSEPVRVQIDSAYELSRTGRLRQRILDLAAPSGGC